MSLAQDLAVALLPFTHLFPQIYLQTMLQESVAQKKMPTNKQLVIPGVTEASALDLIFQNLLIYVADPEQGVNLLKLGGSRSRQGLTPAGQILKLVVGINSFVFPSHLRVGHKQLLIIEISNVISGVMTFRKIFYLAKMAECYQTRAKFHNPDM